MKRTCPGFRYVFQQFKFVVGHNDNVALKQLMSRKLSRQVGGRELGESGRREGRKREQTTLGKCSQAVPPVQDMVAMTVGQSH
jgi:hypothetical protein